MAGPTQREAKRQRADDKVVREQLGTLTLGERLKRFARGESNFRNLPKKVAVQKERVKLAKALAKRRADKKKAAKRKGL